ncbi:4-hydroxy-3-methylbut-2-enyl diphosphate reductase IspH [Siphonobacter sp. SORGH_AS 1065]|nr:4-hydroxy-3-methylbut-2-enyl diphosphate reductase IspH [Siphonobacter sp. SORGH_AS_1065]
MREAQKLAAYMKGEKSAELFYEEFKGQYSEGFSVEEDLKRIGVVNQTTMLASDTQAIADYLKQVMVETYASEGSDITAHFADTRDTLCYATNDNQSATYGLLEQAADLCVVAGGYNSSNTSHLVELCEAKLPTYFIENAAKILDRDLIRHYDLHEKVEKVTEHYLPDSSPVTIMLTCGASCPDKVVEDILIRLLSFYPESKPLDETMEAFV